MTAYVAFLRGINVGGRNRLPMKQLTQTLLDAGYSGVRTYIQSGNIVLESGASDGAALSLEIAGHISSRFGFEVPVIVRTPRQLVTAVQAIPFVSADASKLHITFLSESVEQDAVNRLSDLRKAGEEFAVRGSMVYLHCPDGYGKTRLDNATIEKRLGVQATTRNWRTVNALIEMSPGASQ